MLCASARMASAQVASQAAALKSFKLELPEGDDKQYGGTRSVKDGYTLDVNNKIGEGAYGQVFTGVCKETNEKVALKKIRMDTDQGFPITAIREIKILSSMKHENIVNLREIVRESSDRPVEHKGADNRDLKTSIYMVFDYAENDLFGLMESNRYRFTESQVKCIVKQILKGLAHVHLNGVLHRDLKASNILVNKNGIVKLADFGLARTYQERGEAHLTNKVITLWYRPPELLLGAVNYGPAVDMWSVGCVMVELLVGKSIFPGRDELDQLDWIFKIMGTPTEQSWAGVEKLPQWHSVPKNKYPQGIGLRKWLQDFTTKHQQPMPKPGAIELLEKMLQLDPQKRITALDAFQDGWFWNQDPPACDPSDLPCGGSNHEYSSKKRQLSQQQAAQQQQHQQGGHHHAGGSHRGPYPGGGGGGGGGGAYSGPDAKRARYVPPAGGPSGGYGGGQPRAPTGYGSRPPPAAAAHGSMPPPGPANRGPYGGYSQPPPRGPQGSAGGRGGPAGRGGGPPPHGGSMPPPGGRGRGLGQGSGGYRPPPPPSGYPPRR